MQKSKKHILGAMGLASVAGMTIVAQALPAPEAQAQSSNATSGVQVVVYNTEVPSAEINGPLQDGGATSSPEVTIPVVIVEGDKIKIIVDASQDGKADVEKIYEVEYDLPDGSDGGGYDGVYNVVLPLEQIKQDLVDNYGYDPNSNINLTTTIIVTPTTGGVIESTISFDYGSITIDPNVNINDGAGPDETNVPTNDKGDPIITIGTNDDVERVHVVVRDEETGEIVWEGDVTPDADGKITLPFAENGIPSGNYIIEVQAYDRYGNLIGISSLTIRYVQPDGLGLPNTGGVSIAGLNIAQSDFLISSALAFCLISLGGIYLIHKKSARK